MKVNQNEGLIELNILNAELLTLDLAEPEKVTSLFFRYTNKDYQNIKTFACLCLHAIYIYFLLAPSGAL